MQGLTRTTLAALVVAVLMVLLGLTWIGQGTGFLAGRSFMVGDRTWVVIGAVVAIVGAWLGWRGLGAAGPAGREPAGREPGLPGRLGPAGRDLRSVAGQRQAQERGRPRGAGRRARRRSSACSRGRRPSRPDPPCPRSAAAPKPFHEPAQLAGRDRPAAQVDERDRHPTLLEEPQGGPGRRVGSRGRRAGSGGAGEPLFGFMRAGEGSGDAGRGAAGPSGAVPSRHEEPPMTVWFTVQLDDRPGALARVATALAEREVNITGIVGVAEDTDGALMLTTSDPGRTREAFGGARAPVRGARPERRPRTRQDVGHRRPGPRPLGPRPAGTDSTSTPPRPTGRPPMPRRPNLPPTVALHVVLDDGASAVPDLASAIGRPADGSGR